MNFNAKEIIESNGDYFRPHSTPSLEQFEAWFDKNWNPPDWLGIYAGQGIDDDPLRYIAPAKHAFVNVYEVARCRGGAEEGGWYYDRYTLIYSMMVGKKLFYPVFENACRMHGQYCEGDPQSVLGGTEVCVLLEYERGQSEAKGTPHYE